MTAERNEISPPNCAARDLCKSPWARALWYAAGGAFFVGWLTVWRDVLWVVSLSVAGLLCLANAYHCRRVHCCITGPVYLAGAVLTALLDMEVIQFPWKWLGAAMVIGLGVALLLESLVGNYPGVRASHTR